MGQLGRMFVHSAHQFGYHVAVVDSDPTCPAAQSGDRFFPLFGLPIAERLKALETLADLCDVATLEWENIDSSYVTEIG